METLHGELGGAATVVAVGHLGHSETFEVGAAKCELSDQVEHKLAYLGEGGGASADSGGGGGDGGGRGAAPLALVGHSIGALIALRVAEARKGPAEGVAMVIGQMPFMVVDPASPV